MTKASSDPRWQNLLFKERIALLEKYRECNIHHEWWDCVYEMFIEDMEQIGIEVSANKIWFSGFWCQGDGAGFEGRVKDWAKMFKHLGLLLKLDNYRDNLAYMQFRSTYPRGNCMEYDYYFDLEVCPYDEDDEPLQYNLWYFMRPSAKDVDDLETKLIEVFEEAANKLYKDLEAEYNYLTDDEQIIEYILEKEFDEENLLSCVD